MGLLIDPATVAVPAKGWLYIFNRQGLTKIQARQIEEVHDKLKYYLNGEYTQEDLASAVSAEKRPVVHKYLEAITQAGALLETAAAHGAQDLKVAGWEQDFSDHSQRFLCDGKRVLLSRYGEHRAEPDQETEFDVHFVFCNAEQLHGAWPGIWGQRKTGPHLIYLLRPDSSGFHPRQHAGNFEKRLAVWLMGALRIESWDSRKLHIYSLDSDLSLTLRFEASFTRQPGESTFPVMTTIAEDDQIPLVVAKAAIPYHSDVFKGCGVQYNLLSQELRREFVARATLASLSTNRKAFINECTNQNRFKSNLRGSQADPREALSWPVAGSLLDLRARALERFCWELRLHDPQGSHSEADLLNTQEGHPHIVYLVDVLRTRLGRLPATLRTTASGLHVCECQHQTGYSLIESKAIRDVLLRVTKDIFYGDSLAGVPAKHECDFGSFIGESELQELVGRCEKKLDEMEIGRVFTFRRVQQFGLSAWIGHFHHGNCN